MSKILFPLLLLFTFTLYSHATPKSSKSAADKDITITGKVIDKDTGEPLEYATIAFFSKKDNKIVDGCITDTQGEFSIQVAKDLYNITIEYISYKKITISNKKLDSNVNLGTISLEIDFASLGEVEIIAERTTVEIKLDKKIYNVGKDLTVSGGNVSDVLDNIPSVSVDVEGNVALRGNDNVTILINGKPSGLVGLNSTEALRQLPADAIEKVEVITSPSARYQSEGTAGILNIILRRSKLQGFNGAITTNAGYPNSAGISGNVNYRTGDINFFSTTSYNYRESPGHSYTFTKYKAEGNYIDEKNDWDNTSKGLTSNIGLEWYINDSASLTTSLVYRDSDNERYAENKIFQFDENLNLTGQSLRLEPEFGDSKTIQYATNFTKNFKTSGHKFTFDFQYEDNDDNKNSIIVNDGVNSEQITTLENQQNILLQSDYVLPIGENSQFELGYRGDFSTKSTDYAVDTYNEATDSYTVNDSLSNIFNFKVYISALYAQYGSKINKFSYLFGLRMENTQTTIDQPTTGYFKKKNITGLFPTINFSYELNDKESLTLGYSRRLQRPRGHHLNPFPSRTSLTNIFQGNPDLDPSYSGLFDLGYLNRFSKVTLSTSIYFQHEKDESNWVSFETGETVSINGQDIPVIQRTPVNMAKEDRFGYEFNVNYTPTRKWRINTDFNLFKNMTRGDYNGVNYDADNLSWNVRLSNKYTLPGNIDWQTNMDYRGPSKDAQNTRDGIFSINLALSKDLFEDKASIAFNISDLLNSRRYKGDINTPTFYTTRDLQFRVGQSFNLSFTYRFNQKKKPERPNNRGEGFDIDG
ncbi:outer membrane beta-barrel protein [Mariniflexile sp. AS56]|uniref:outer membrane beta-barrel protein n=1 Tax=Mariniflexile sp. AS56 TaxID=3063957 RepID=UPI0026EF2BC9|nr:outer membrane beta-barrel protein [Mariniflexile sp. AS56]MDO7171314.1 TonB-dependent receptor [Mariniflexile sp. AS56]